MNPSNLRVLVVDDMMTMRKLVIKALKDMGVTQYEEAPDGAQGWNKLGDSQSRFDLVISDWNMPNTTGLELLRQVRADGRLKSLPFLMVTAESEMSQVQDAMKAGVSGYIVKPFSQDKLRAKVTEILSKQEPKKG